MLSDEVQNLSTTKKTLLALSAKTARRNQNGTIYLHGDHCGSSIRNQPAIREQQKEQS